MIFSVGGKKIGGNSSPFIIAEAGINHNGNVDIAKEMIVAAKEANVDAIKFQTFRAEEFIQDHSVEYSYYSNKKLVKESMFEMFKRYEFSKAEWKIIKDYCDENDIVFLSTPQNISDLNLLMELGVDAIKVGSDDFVNIPLIRYYSKQGLPMLVSCGMSDADEITKIVKTIVETGNRSIVLFLCTSQYPTNSQDVNISRITSMKREYPGIVLGFSDHTIGVEAAIMSLALGARVFEKHFTLSHNLEGPDHWFSLEPMELSNWVECIRRGYEMIGSPKLVPTKSEVEMRKIARRSITALRDIRIGEVLSEANIGMRRPGTGIWGIEWDNIAGLTTKREIKKGERISWEDI